jgi:hypothetical protein
MELALKKLIFLLLPLIFIFSSCNALKSITGGETDLDPSFFIGSDSLFEGLIDFYQFEESGTSSRRSLVDRFDLTTQGRTIGSASGISGSGVNCGSVGGGPADFYLKNDNFVLSGDSDTSYSFSFWYKPNSLSGTHSIIERRTGTVMRINLPGDGSDLDIYADINGFTVTAIDVFDNTSDFRHITVVFSAPDNQVYIYVDGSNSPWNSNGFTPGNYTFNDLGVCSDNASTQPADGILDSLGIWERELSHDERYRLYSGANTLD